MEIKNAFEVDQPLDKVWAFFGDIPAVASCLPGTELTDEVGPDHYAGTVLIGVGPVRLDFNGEAKITDRDEMANVIKVDANGADKKGRGQAAMKLEADLDEIAGGTKVGVLMDLQIAGAAAQYGRGLVSDVTSVLLDDFATNVRNRLIAIDEGRDPSQVAASSSAGGLAIGLRAMRMALARVWRRFFLPYNPEAV